MDFTIFGRSCSVTLFVKRKNASHLRELEIAKERFHNELSTRISRVYKKTKSFSTAEKELSQRMYKRLREERPPYIPYSTFVSRCF